MDCLCGLCYICVFLLSNLNNMHIVVLGVVGPEMAMDFGSEEVEPKLMRGLFMDSPRIVFGTVKNSPSLLVEPKMSMCYLHKICLK